MTSQSTPAAATAAAKKEVREALTSEGLKAKVTASTTWINVRVADAADRPAVLALFPGSTAPDYDSRTVYISR